MEPLQVSAQVQTEINSMGEGMEDMIKGSTLHNAVLISGGLFTDEMLEGILQMINE